jgi:hypothetical protein
VPQLPEVNPSGLSPKGLEHMARQSHLQQNEFVSTKWLRRTTPVS